MSFSSILILVIAVVAIWAVIAYNRLVMLTNRVGEAWADIDVQLKRRYDLIPNLVSTVKGYAAHESGTLEKVTELRNQAMAAQGVGERAQAEGALAGALKSVFALAENYPNLKANENFVELQRELSDTENKIQAARRFYNTNVRDLNTGLQQFPGNVIGNMFSFKSMEFFDLPDNDVAQNPVEVKF